MSAHYTPAPPPAELTEDSLERRWLQANPDYDPAVLLQIEIAAVHEQDARDDAERSTKVVGYAVLLFLFCGLVGAIVALVLMAQMLVP